MANSYLLSTTSYKPRATSYRLVAMVLSMLIVMTPFSYSILDWEEEEQEAQTGESIIVNVDSYEPTVLPSSVIEDGDVPVYVYLTGVTPGTILKDIAGSTSNAEPLYGNVDIKQVYIRPENEETLNYVRGNPKYVKPQKVSIDNLGYLIVTLKQIEKEADVPDEIKLNMRAEITFENAERLYSMIEQDLIIPEDPDEAAWREKPIEDYRFFAGRGAIRASSISEGEADLTVYGGVDLAWPFTGSPRPLEDLTLSKGETSDPIRMSAASDFMTNAFRVKLTDIVDPSQKRARIRVNVNGEEKEYIVTEGSKLYPGSSLTVKEINVVRNAATSKVTYEIVVRGPRDTTRITKTFFEKIAEGAADLLGLVSNDAETAVRDVAGVDQTGSAAANAEGVTPSEVVAGTDACSLIDGACAVDCEAAGRQRTSNTAANNICEDAAVIAGTAQSLAGLTPTESMSCCVPASTPIPGDEKCFALGGTCADTTHAMCYDDNEELIDFVRLKCGGGAARQCCVGRVDITSESDTTGTAASGTSTIRGSETLLTSNAGEGVCKNKVIVLREGDTPEQWLKIIKEQATQEMVYCTAIEEYKRIASLYFGIEDENGALYEDMANFRIGEIYYWLGDSETALIYYNKAIKNNKGEFILLARARIDELTEEALHHTRFKVGEFEENGVSIRVKVMEVLWQEESSKPSATVDVENEGTKKLKAGDSIFSQDATDSTNGGLKYNWLVKDINFDSILVEQKYRTETPEGYRVKTKVVQADAETRLDYGSTYRTARLKSVDMKKYAIVTVIPGTGAPLVSTTNFTVHVPIEKRAISLTPDEISGKINSTQEIIDDLDDIITTLNDVVVLWKKVCLVTFGYLTIKNSFFTGLARTQARKFAMHGPDGNSGWDAYCRQNSGENRLYEDYEKCIIENSDNIESTTDASQDAIETVNNEMENYQDQPWYKQLTTDYTNLGEYQDYMGDDLYSPEQLRDYRYWQLMKQTPVYNDLRGARQGEGYAYDLRSEVDTRLSSMTMGNEEKKDAYLKAVSNVESNYENFDTLSEQEKTALFSDLYGSNLANPDTRSSDFTYIETIGVTPLATIRREGRELYSNTPNGRITLHEATITDYQRGLADAMSTESGRMPEGFTEEMKEEFIAESQRIEAQYETNLNAPLRTNQGQVYVDDQGYFYSPMTTAYTTGETRDDYAPGASVESYPNGKPYCIPTCSGNYVKVLDFYQDGSPSVIQQWNVGTDGLMCTEDDLLVQHQSMLERPEMESTQRRLIEQATSAGTHSEGQVLSACGRDFTVSTSRSQADTSRSSATCYDVMDPDDCRLLFGVCDPVMCPPSRFNMGGSWQVDDVVQTGLIGSLVLGLHNFDLPYEPVPICLTGVLAGLQNIKSVLRGYVECLKTAQVQGISVGICDKIRSVFICELIWKEAIAILNIKGGIMNWISQTFLDQGSGGGEYLTFESSISNVEDSVSFFTEQYATTAFASYTGRSSEELGTTLCKQAIFGQTPAFGEFFDQLAQPESPPQYTALLTVMDYSETQQQSRYEVFYHIYAGEDNPATYSVTLKNSITGDTLYFTERCDGRQGSIEKGGIASFNIDCPRPKGFDQVCITLNGNTECGFGKVSTDFALNYLSDLVVSDEAQRNINSEEDCSPSSPRTSPALGSIPLPGTTGILSSGVQRVCSVQNPGQGTNPIDWKEVGTCGKDTTGRSLGACWIDMRTVSIHDTDRMQSVTDALDEVGFRQRREEMGMDLLEYNESINELNMIDETASGICEGTRVAECGEITNAMSSYRYLESVTVTPRIAAKAGYQYSCLMEKAAEQCALFDLRSAVSRLENDFEYDIEAIYYEFLDKFEADVAPFMQGDELPHDFTEEYQARLTERFKEAKTNLTNMRGMTEEKFTEYVGGIQAIYDRAFTMDDPFAFHIAISAEEQGQTSQIEENKCMACGDGAGTICKKGACHDIGKTSSARKLYCYYERGTGISIGGNDYTAWNKCHTCSRLSSCSEMTDDKDMCESAVCTSQANNGEGLSCKYVAGQCVEKPASEAQAESGTTTGTTGTGSSSITGGATTQLNTRIASAIKGIGGKSANSAGIGVPKNCGDWLARVYKWAGYAFIYPREISLTSLQQLGDEYGYPIGYNDNRPTAGHALMLLGFGAEMNKWLEQFPDIPLATTGARTVNENQALTISYYGPEVKFNIYPKDSYRYTIVRVHPWTPLCDGEYLPATTDAVKYGTTFNGQSYWSNDGDGNKKNEETGFIGNPWSRYWEPASSPYYPAEGDCSDFIDATQASSTPAAAITGSSVTGTCPQVTILDCSDRNNIITDLSKVDMTNLRTVNGVKSGINKALIPTYKTAAANKLPWELLAVLHYREGGGAATKSVLNGHALCNNNDGSRCSACDAGVTLENDLKCGTEELLAKAGKTKIEATDITTIKKALWGYGGTSSNSCADASFHVTAFFDATHSNMWKSGIDCVPSNCDPNCVTDATLATGRQPRGCCAIKVYPEGGEPAGFNPRGESHCNSVVRSECITNTGEKSGIRYVEYTYKPCVTPTEDPCGALQQQNRPGSLTIYAILKKLQETDATLR